MCRHLHKRAKGGPCEDTPLAHADQAGRSQSMKDPDSGISSYIPVLFRKLLSEPLSATSACLSLPSRIAPKKRPQPRGDEGGSGAVGAVCWTPQIQNSAFLPQFRISGLI